MRLACLPHQVWLVLLTSLCTLCHAEGDPRTHAVQSFLRDVLHQPDIGVVVGWVDQDGTRITRYGTDRNGADLNYDGDTVFEIGSITKTFTALLLQDMVDRHDVKFDDPAATYLPDTVRVPTFNSHPITLLHLATQSSGLPFNPSNFSHKDDVDPFADYTSERLYSFLSAYTLTQEPGRAFSYSNVGMGLLGHVLSRKAGKDFESLIVERICLPLKMNDTRITLAPAWTRRLAPGHDASGQPAPNLEFQALAGAGAMRSTANDLLKYVSAQLGLTDSNLTPLMRNTHVIRFRDGVRSDDGWVPGNSGMPWVDNGVEQPPGMQLMGHGGGTAGYSAFVGFDTRRRRGVVVLCNQQGGPVHASSIGWVLLQQRPLTRAAVAEVMMHGREIVGIGVALDVDSKTHMVRITKVFPGSPAAEAGLSEGQIIRRIGDVATVDKPLAQCAPLIRGPEGTQLSLEVSDAEGKSRRVAITRHKIKL